MPTSASTRLGLIGPLGADQVANGDDIIRAIIAQLEVVGAAFEQGTSRPTATAALQGYFYVDTGTPLVSYCTGSVWLDFQPYDSDLAAIAALSTTPFGRSVLTQADAAALRTLTGLGTAATQASSAFDAAGAAAAAQAASQPLDSDLTAIAALTTTNIGRSLLAGADAAALRTIIGAMAATDGEYAYSTYKKIQEMAGYANGSAVGAGTYLLSRGAGQALGAIGAGTDARGFPFYLDPADFAAGSRTVKGRIRATAITDSQAPGITFTVGLYPVSAFGGGSSAMPFINTIGSVVAGSAPSALAPGASATAVQVGADFTLPTAGFYVLGVVLSGTNNVSNITTLSAELQVRQV